MRIFITGGAGYKGTALTKKLLEGGFKVTVCDTFWFGDFLGKHKNLNKIRLNINDIKQKDIENHDAIIHLASIANDPGSLLNSKLSWETIVLGTYKLCVLAKSVGIRKFIYASSGSVYGFRKERHVREDCPLEPLSDYNKCKMVAERTIMSFSKDLDYIIVRPATVCGISPRMRLDVSVNMFVFQAFKDKQLNIFGGKQIRPNIHIDDIISIYIYFLKNKKSGIYNAGFENISIENIAKQVSKKFDKSKLIFTKSNDPRSYRLNSDKLLKIGFKPKKNVSSAIDELTDYFSSTKFREETHMYTVRHMKKLKL